jgi:glycosyltransferase involved in cell wall biosynthesis
MQRSLAVGAGTALFVRGACLSGSAPIRALRLVVDGRTEPVAAHGLNLGAPGTFWAIHPVGAIREPRRLELALEASLADGTTIRRDLPATELCHSSEWAAVDAPVPPGDAPLVAICMATYEPRAELFRHQIESIRAQSHERWICVISDDRSSAEAFERIRSIAAEDPRFVVSSAPARLGPYRNFERALAMAPAAATHVALADQDDFWHSDKLATLLERIGDAKLVYADMRILSESGEVLAGSFWGKRRNNFTNLGSLLLANTVTGAASLFRRDLLELVLPFPPPTPDAFHDQWLAAVALASGAIAYVDRPLHDYVQHEASVLGHAATVRRYRPARLVEPLHPRRTVAAVAEHARRSYELNVMRIALLASALEARLGARLRGRKKRAVRRLARLGSTRAPVVWLALRSLRPLAGRSETVGIEFSVLAAVGWRELTRRRAARRAASRPGRSE